MLWQTTGTGLVTTEFGMIQDCSYFILFFMFTSLGRLIPHGKRSYQVKGFLSTAYSYGLLLLDNIKIGVSAVRVLSQARIGRDWSSKRVVQDHLLKCTRA